MSSSEDQDTQEDESPVNRHRPDSPEPSSVSMKSDQSIDKGINLKEKKSFTELRHRPDSPELSCVSMKSDHSIDIGINLNKENSSTEFSPVNRHRPDSPEPSSVSMKSDQSIDKGINLKEKKSFTELRHRPDSPELSCVSMKSDHSIDIGINLKRKKSFTELSPVNRHRPDSPEPSSVSMKSDQSIDKGINLKKKKSFTELRVQKTSSEEKRRRIESILKDVEHKVFSLVKNQLKRFMKLLSPDYPACSEREEEDEEDQSVREGVMKITLHVLKNMNQTDLANTLQTKLASPIHTKIKSTLREKFQKMNEGISNPGSSVFLNEIYTELYITEGGSGEVNTEHEVRQIQTASRRPAVQDKPIKCNDLFKDQSIKTVLTKGVAGIGKTVSVQKFILDWAEGKANQDVLFIFPLPFRELNLMKERKLSLVDLLQQFFTDTKYIKPSYFYHYKVMFIFDGLDECRLPLDFQNNENVFDVRQSASVDVLLTNLIKGNLLPSALLWITTRPAAANQIPPDCINQVTEIRGFSDPQKEEYFKKRISDQSLTERIITHMKSSRSLYIMCHIPVFCWISATVLERMLGEAESGEIPKTLTQMFTHFLIFQLKHSNQKYQRKSDIDHNQTRKIILALGKLAFQQLEKGNLIFYEEDLRECGIDVREVLVYSGVCTQIFREEFGLHLGKVFSFVHLSVQEFLAALYAFLSFFISRDETKHPTTDLSDIFTKSTMSDFFKSAVDKSLQSENGHLDLFLRFLLGLSLESNQTLLRVLLTQTGSRSHNKEETVQYIKKKIRENPSPEKTINLFHCLNELNDDSLVQEVQSYLNRGGSSGLSGDKLSPDQWSAVAFVMLNSEEELDEFDLRKYDPSEECLLRLLPVVKEYRNVVLSGCGVTERGCAALLSVLKSNPSHLKELNLNYNKPGTSGVKLLSDLLQDPRCKLEKLHLSGCKLSEESCESLCSVLNSSLKELDLSNNDLQDSGLKLLSTGLRSSYSQLKILRLSGCKLTTNCCKKLVSALQSVNSSLKELDLSNNDLQDSGVELISAGLKSSYCNLEILRLSRCNFTTNSCKTLVSVLQSVNSSLKELDLSNNDLQDSGVELISAGLKSSYCNLEILRLSGCNLTTNSCKTLVSVLQSVNSSLKELDLSNNDLQDSGVELISAGLKSSYCNLETLRLSGCMITQKGCSSLTSALKSNSSHLRELDLTYNHPGESGVKELSDLLEDPLCTLKNLQMNHGGKIRMKPGLKKYAVEITLDPNTANTVLALSENNRKVASGRGQQSYPDHPDRFVNWLQVLSEEGLTGRCYWEVDWSNGADISVSYRGIKRNETSQDGWFGHNDQSWSLNCSDNSYSVSHSKQVTTLPVHPSGSRTVGVYLDWSAGTLSFYRICPNTHTLTHLHTFTNTFTEPLYAGFKIWGNRVSSVQVCKME